MKNITKNSALFLGLVSFVLGFAGPLTTLAASSAPVSLGSAGNFVILTKSGISTTGSTVITGDIGVSPITASAITGFALTLPSASEFSTSASVTGKIYASDYANPTPASLTTAVLDMQTAYTDAAGRASDVTELGAGNIGGLTLAPGVYKWNTGVTIPTDVTLSGSANDVWIFQIAQTLTVSSGVRIVLSGGAQASNIFWVVGGQTTVGTTATVNGTILDQTAIVLNTGATLNGRALAQTAVTLDSNSVTIPSGGSAPSQTPTPSPAPSPTPTPSHTPASTQTAITNTSTQPTSSDTNSAMHTQINGLLMTLQSLQEAQAVSSNSARTIAISLGQGSRGTDVTTLQQFLISHNTGSASVALGAIGATGYFGVHTRAALAEFQANVGIPSLGNFGPITRAYINTH